MHDLNTIVRMNAQAFENGINNFRSQGRHVLVKRAGLHLVSMETFPTAADAAIAYSAAVQAASPDEVFEVLAPLPDRCEARAT